MILSISQVFILITAVVFTYFGRYMERSNQDDRTHLIIENTIDRLIKDNYIKTNRNKDGEIEMLKYYED